MLPERARVEMQDNFLGAINCLLVSASGAEYKRKRFSHAPSFLFAVHFAVSCSRFASYRFSFFLLLYLFYHSIPNNEQQEFFTVLLSG